MVGMGRHLMSTAQELIIYMYRCLVIHLLIFGFKDMTILMKESQSKEDTLKMAQKNTSSGTADLYCSLGNAN